MSHSTFGFPFPVVTGFPTSGQVPANFVFPLSAQCSQGQAVRLRVNLPHSGKGSKEKVALEEKKILDSLE
jgi:hypothetical protein